MAIKIKIAKDSAAWMIKRYHGRQFFTVTFVKRSNGELRTMNCRKGVTIGVNGNGMKFNPADHDLVTVWDVQKRDFRSIPLDSIREISMAGNEYIVE